MQLKETLSAKNLQELYSTQRISSPKIAAKYGCDPKYVRSLLRKHDIPIRTKSEARELLFHIDTPKEKLQKLYVQEKLSCPKIAKQLNCSPGYVLKKLREYGIPVRDLQEALPLSNISRYPRKDFSGNLEEQAYLTGLTKGDLYIRKKSEKSSSIFVEIGSTKIEMLNLVERSFIPYGHLWKGRPVKNGVVSLRCSLNTSFSFLLNLTDRIDPWILEHTKYFAAFLAGYSDAEATFCICRRNGVFSIRSQDKIILGQIHEKLVDLGILFRPPQIVRRKGTRDIRGTISNEDIWGFWVHRKDALLKLFELMQPYMRHGDKLREMEIVRNNIYERNQKYHRLQGSKHDKLYLEEGIQL